jgi:hypothetical protein
MEGEIVLHVMMCHLHQHQQTWRLPHAVSPCMAFLTHPWFRTGCAACAYCFQGHSHHGATQ